MQIDSVTKLYDNSCGAPIAIEKSINVSQKKMKEDVKELLEEYDLNEDVSNYVYTS